MGLPSDKFSEAKKVLLSLQSGDRVNELLTELRGKAKASDAEDKDTQEAITCLVQQLVDLGLKSTNTEALKDVAERVAHSNTRTRAGSEYYAPDIIRDNLAEKVFEDLANYKNLRDPLTWQSDNLVSPDPEERMRSMVRFQADKITQSLTVMNPRLEKIAIQNFLDLLRCMGDKPCAFTGNKQDPILKRLIISRRICDEVYVQVMKQLTDNPSTDSTARGWDLLKKMVQEALPSAEVNEFLRVFVSREAEILKGSQGASSDDMSKKDLRRALLDSARKQLTELKKKNALDPHPVREQKRVSMADVVHGAVARHAAVSDQDLSLDARQGGGGLDPKASGPYMTKSRSDRGPENRIMFADHGAGSGSLTPNRLTQRRTSRVAAAEMRQDDIVSKRKSFAAKQVVIAKEVQAFLKGGSC